MSENENQVNSGDHSHHQKPHYDDVNAPVMAMLAVITTVVVFAIVATMQGFFNQMSNEKYYDNAYKTMGSEFVANEQKALNDGSADRGITKIDDSMKKAVSNAGGTWKKVHSHSHGGASHTHTEDEHLQEKAEHGKEAKKKDSH